MKTTMKQPIPLLIIFTLLLIPCSAQVTNTGMYKPLEKVIKRGGWDIPKFENEESYLLRNTTVESYPVTTRNYRLEKPVEMEWNFYSLRVDDNSLIITSTRTIEVRGLTTYIAEGKTFAYGIIGVPIFTSDESRFYAVAVLTSYYVDEDGDGNFEMRYMNKMPDKIPNWIPKDLYKMETTPPPPIKPKSKPLNSEIKN